MSRELADLIASRFIARTDVKAIQHSNSDGEVIYSPVRSGKPPNQVNLPWTRDDLEAHLAGTKTFGHYLVNQDDMCKLLCFDIDLEQSGWLPTTFEPDVGPGHFERVDDLRGAWHTRNHPARTFMKAQFHDLAHRISKVVTEITHYDVAVCYSGNKGVHIYVFFPEKRTADRARIGSDYILETFGKFEDTKGSKIFYKSVDKDPESGYPNLSIEVFPKQDSINKEGLGNLLRLPLGRNLKHSDPTFFVDMTAPMNTLTPVDPIRALTPGYNMWQTSEEAIKLSSVGSNLSNET